MYSPTQNSPPSSPARTRKPAIPNGFRAPPKPKRRPISEMTVRELNDLHNMNARILSSPGASTSTYVERVVNEQRMVEARLIELEGMETINSGLKQTRIISEEAMSIDIPDEPPISRAIQAKRKALSQYIPPIGTAATGSFSLQEAIELEQRTHALDMERQQQAVQRKRRLGLPMRGEVLTREEQEARMLAFLNYKPTESDLEDDDDDESDDDPSTWFEDDQDDGRKGQDIIDPDPEDLQDIIRVDESRIPWSRDE